MGRKWANIVAKNCQGRCKLKVYAKFGVEVYVAAKKGKPDQNQTQL